jgi:mono/diheme cytochrome c family protein
LKEVSMLTRKLPCPSCGVGLKIADDLPTGKKITCPKCGQGFPVPQGNGQAQASRPATARVRKPAPPEEEEELDSEEHEEMEDRPVVRKRRRPPPTKEEEESDDEIEERPLPRKRRKLRKKKPSRLPLILGLVAGALVLLVAAGVTFAVIKLLPSDKKADQTAANTPPRSGPPSGPPMRPGGEGGQARGGPERSSPPAAQDSPEPRPSQPNPNAGESDQYAAGKEVFQRSCARCHRIGGSEGGGGGFGRSRGPDLGTIGRTRDADWLMGFVRDPKSRKPGSNMPAIPPQRLTDEDLRAVAVYLASLK